MDKEQLSLGLVLFTEVLGFTLIIPFLPYYAEQFGATPLTVGLIFASFSACQFLSAPIIGKLSDRFGRKPLLIISQLSTLTGFIILGLANSVWMIFLSRIIDGLFGSNMTLTRTYISDLKKGKERTKAYSRFGAIEGLGFFVGPAMGGLLAYISYSLPSLIAAGITLISLILTIKYLPETITSSSSQKVKISITDFFPLKQFISALKKDNLRRLLGEFFFYFLGYAVIITTLALFVKHQLGMGPEEVGFMLMLIGSLRFFYQLKSLPKLIDKHDERKLKMWGFVATITSMILFIFIINRLTFYPIMGLFALGIGLTRPIIISQVSDTAIKSERGEIMGVLDSLNSITQIIGPLIGGYLLTFFNPQLLGPVSAVIVLIGFLLAVSEWRYLLG